MRNLTLGVCFFDEDDNVIIKRNIGTNWSINDEQDLRKKFNIYMEQEIASILYENLKLQLTEDVVLEMVKELQCQDENRE